jgi:PleD family two-component response regulator
VFTLRLMGCDIIQGFYFSRPLPAVEFERFVTAKSSLPVFNKPETRQLLQHDNYSYNALHDPLTGLYNYSAFDILFRDSDQEHIAVMIADVDSYDKIKREKGREYAKNSSAGLPRC